MKLLHYLIFFSIIFIINACEDETPFNPFNPVEPIYYTAWTTHPDVRLDNIHLQSAYATDDRLYVAGKNHFLTFDEQHQLVNDHLISTDGVNLGYKNIPVITEKVFGYLDHEGGNYGQRLKLHLNENPSMTTIIDITQYNPLWRIDNDKNHSFVVTPNDELIFIANYTSSYNANGIPDSSVAQVVSFDLDISNAGISATFKDSITVQRTNQPRYTLRTTGLYFRNNLFYYNLNEHGLYAMEWTTKNTAYISDLRYSFFLPTTDTFFVVGHTISDYLLQFNYELNATPYIWDLNKSDIYDNGWMRFVTIQDKIIGYKSGYMIYFSLDFPNNLIKARFLGNIDLDSQIYQLIEFKDRVYAVTPTGLFAKTPDGFF